MTLVLIYMLSCFFTTVIDATKLPYDLHSLNGPTVINYINPTSKSTIDIYCYSGTNKSLLALWQIAQFNIKINNDEFGQYIGETPQEVYKQFTEERYGWSSEVNPFKKLPYKTVSLALFSTTCMAINTKHPHAVELEIITIDKWRLLTMLTGLILIFFSRQFFIICYCIGPQRDRKSQNIVIILLLWTIQIAATLMIYFSSEFQEASTATTLVALTCKYFPEKMLYKIKCYWFPPKHRFLSNKEYCEQGARETIMALENLRKYCASPDCAQWRIIMKLDDPKRFASFVEGGTHSSDEEVLDYTFYALSQTERITHNISNLNVNSSNYVHGSVNNLEISDDDVSLIL